MSIVLGVDTSSRELGLGLVRDGVVVTGWSHYGGQSHSEHISLALRSLCEANNLTPDTITHIAVAVGPGSFTGLRIGISFCKGFCFGRVVPVLPVSSLMAVAVALPCSDRPVVVAFEARRGDVFWARFMVEPGRIVRVTDDCLMPAVDFAGQLAADDCIVTDTMGFARSSVFYFLAGRPAVFAVENVPLQRGVACAKIAAMAIKNSASVDLSFTSVTDIAPRYLRDFDIVACRPPPM